jgi:hypothetical protein
MADNCCRVVLQPDSIPLSSVNYFSGVSSSHSVMFGFNCLALAKSSAARASCPRPWRRTPAVADGQIPH